MTGPAASPADSAEAERRALIELLLAEEGLTAPQSAGPEPRAEPASPAALSFAQQRLWFLEQFDPGGAAYHVPGRAALEGRAGRRSAAGGPWRDWRGATRCSIRFLPRRRTGRSSGRSLRWVPVGRKKTGRSGRGGKKRPRCAPDSRRRRLLPSTSRAGRCCGPGSSAWRRRSTCWP